MSANTLLSVLLRGTNATRWMSTLFELGHATASGLGQRARLRTKGTHVQLTFEGADVMLGENTVSEALLPPVFSITIWNRPHLRLRPSYFLSLVLFFVRLSALLRATSLSSFPTERL